MIILLKLVFIILFIRQIIIVLIALWTGYKSDVPYEATSNNILPKLLIDLDITNKTKIYDLGSGTGRVAIFLAQHTPGQIIGIENNRFLYYYSLLFVKALKLSNLTIINQDLFKHNLNQADITYTYFSPTAYKKIKTKFETELKTNSILFTWRYPFYSQKFKLIHKTKQNHTLYTYKKI